MSDRSGITLLSALLCLALPPLFGAGAQPPAADPSPTRTCDNPRPLRGTLFIFDQPTAHTPPPGDDSDGDGLPDWWERMYLGDLSGRGSDDIDGDGQSNAAEYAAGSDPWRADTDGDGVADRDDPNPDRSTDVDGDGLPDDWERAWFGTLDRTATDDDDGDGRSHLQEYQEGTDPTRADTPDGGATLPLVVFLPLE